MISTEKPGTPQDLALEHHGVLGMRWGHRKSGSSSGGGRRAANRQANSTFNRKNPTSADRSRAILRARAATNSDFTKAITEKTTPKAKKASQVYLNNPDRATALRMTRGEKVLAVVLSVGVPPAAPAIAGYAGSQVLIRKHIERKQARGGYK